MRCRAQKRCSFPNEDSRISEDSIQQFIEFPTLLDDEFDEFFSDRTGWYFNKFLPVSTVMEPFKDFRINVNHRGILDVANSFSRPDIREAIERMWAISDFYRNSGKRLRWRTENLSRWVTRRSPGNCGCAVRQIQRYLPRYGALPYGPL